jgi:CheY-like chemotaxis protein
MSTAQVLLVEDDADHRRALAITLRLGGYATRECASGEDALAQLGHLAPGPSEIDAVVLDVRLPGIDGVEVLTRIRDDKSTRCLPVVLISAHATIPNSVQCDEHASFVPKPFHPDQLLHRLSELLPHTPEESPDARDDH